MPKPASKCHAGKCELSSTHSQGQVTVILTVGIDLAKNAFSLHGLNEAGQPELPRPRVPRAKLHALVAALPRCTIGDKAQPCQWHSNNPHLR
jgi:hypothetical protein